MGDVIDHIDPRKLLLFHQVDRLTFLLAENRDQNIGSADFTLAG